jgi:4-diphosphocytidyl-2-C-methyl-D-erythritol kinase
MSAGTTLLAHACAKVNLSLEVLRKRCDEYHEIETIFQSVRLFDELTITVRGDRDIRITGSDPGLPAGKNNICHKAVVELRKHVARSFGADIHIVKRIPQSAGLGGGSADAAAVLLACNEILSLRLPTCRSCFMEARCSAEAGEKSWSR